MFISAKDEDFYQRTAWNVSANRLGHVSHQFDGPVIVEKLLRTYHRHIFTFICFQYIHGAYNTWALVSADDITLEYPDTLTLVQHPRGRLKEGAEVFYFNDHDAAMAALATVQGIVTSK